MIRKRVLELLSPARDAEVAREAILHGADAVYMGPPSHGARKAASNSLDDIRRTVEFAHQFRARVYATVNTLIYERELRSVERMICDLYRIGVDALIIQDMGILRLDIPPIPLHASTQCDNRTPEKARFLEEVGFSQIVLARELSIQEIDAISKAVSVPIEVFVHGALCVSYSGRCNASYRACGRSANRGECAQLCRLPYTLCDSDNRIIAKDRYLLSLKDLNASDRLKSLVEAGASSFKIEGRLKDAAYVKNVTAYYRNRIDALIADNPEKYSRSSFGCSEISFTPDVAKSFNRSFTHYFLDSNSPKSISSPLTPKAIGEPIKDLTQLHNGDGISWFDNSNTYRGALVNNIRDNRIILSDGTSLSSKTNIFRTSDLRFNQILSKPTAKRYINTDIHLDRTGLTAKDERGVAIRIPIDTPITIAKTPQNHASVISKLGATIYRARTITSDLTPDDFIPISALTALKRKMTEALDLANKGNYHFCHRQPENKNIPFLSEKIDFSANVANSLAKEFYRNHGVSYISDALETGSYSKTKKVPVMTTRHCILRELGRCKKEVRNSEPLYISHGNRKYRLSFDCKRCQMTIIED